MDKITQILYGHIFCDKRKDICLMQNGFKVIKIGKACTSGLHSHFSIHHKILFSNSENLESSTLHQKEIYLYIFKQVNNSMPVVLSRMTAADELLVNSDMFTKAKAQKRDNAL